MNPQTRHIKQHQPKKWTQKWCTFTCMKYGAFALYFIVHVNKNQ